MFLDNGNKIAHFTYFKDTDHGGTQIAHTDPTSEWPLNLNPETKETNPNTDYYDGYLTDWLVRSGNKYKGTGVLGYGRGSGADMSQLQQALRNPSMAKYTIRDIESRLEAEGFGSGQKINNQRSEENAEAVSVLRQITEVLTQWHSEDMKMRKAATGQIEQKRSRALGFGEASGGSSRAAKTPQPRSSGGGGGQSNAKGGMETIINQHSLLAYRNNLTRSGKAAIT